MNDDAEVKRVLPTTEQIEYFKRAPFAHAVAIVFGVPDGIVKNATATLIEVNSRHLAITNYHILQAYRLALAADANTIFQIGGNIIDPLEHCWDAEQDKDLLVLDVSGFNFARQSHESDIPTVAFLKPAVWPAPEAVEGDDVVFGGFPELYRATDGAGAIFLYTWSVVNVPVTGAYGDRFLVSWIGPIGVRKSATMIPEVQNKS